MLLYLYLFPGPPVSPVFLCLFFGVFVVFEFLYSFGIFLRLPFCCLPFSLLGSWAVAIKASCGFRAVSVRILTSPVSASLLAPHAISSFAFSQIPSAPSPLSPPVSLLMSPLLPLSFTHIFLLYSQIVTSRQVEMLEIIFITPSSLFLLYSLQPPHPPSSLTAVTDN